MCFSPCNMRMWNGRYVIIPGNESKFHIRWRGEEYGWWICVERNSNYENTVYWAEDTDSNRLLKDAVNMAKLRLNGRKGGSFIINEFGQVLVPADNGKDRYIVGQINNNCRCENLFINGNQSISLSNVTGLNLGDLWERPYVGIPYVLSKNMEIYTLRDGGEFEYREVLNKNYNSLIYNIIRVRRAIGCRFIVNPWGVVLTKIQRNGNWIPVFVQKLDYNYWFPKEE